MKIADGCLSVHQQAFVTFFAHITLMLIVDTMTFIYELDRYPVEIYGMCENARLSKVII